MEPALERYVDPAGWSLAYPPGRHVMSSAVVDPSPMTDVTVLRSGPSFYRDTCSHHVDGERLEVYCAECGAR